MKWFTNEWTEYNALVRDIIPKIVEKKGVNQELEIEKMRNIFFSNSKNEWKKEKKLERDENSLMKHIIIEKKYSISNQDCTKITLKGTLDKAELDEQKVNDLLDRLFSERIWPLQKLISAMKTIFSMVQNPTLQIDQRNGVFRYLISLVDWKLEEYSDQIQRGDGSVITIRYSKDKGISMTADNSDQTLFDEKQLSLFKFFVDNDYRFVESIPTINKVTISEKLLRLCTIYHFFYQENPDFSKEECRNRMHDMLSLLAFCNLIEENSIIWYQKETGEIPDNSPLIEAFRQLAPLGEIEIDEGMSFHHKEEILTLGKAIQTYRQNTDFDDEELHRLVLSLFSSPNLSMEEIELDMENLTGAAFSVAKTVKKIKKRTQSQ